MREKFKIQDDQYIFPYHYLVELKKYNLKRISWGVKYYCYIKHTIDYIQSLEFQTLIDVGCGDGRLISEMANENKEKRFHGIDLSHSAINLAKALNYQQDNLQFAVQDIEEVDEKFDVVVLNEVLEHIPDEDMGNFTENVIARLKKGGKLVITVPSKNVPLSMKHYRHYDSDMLTGTFSELKLIEKKFLFKHSKMNKLFYELFNRINFKKLELFVAEKLMFKAHKKNCSLIFVVFEK